MKYDHDYDFEARQEQSEFYGGAKYFAGFCLMVFAGIGALTLFELLANLAGVPFDVRAG